MVRMSKLLKLKEWLTVADAARHLTIIFGEEVTEADVLRFALDGELKLSVNFVNCADAFVGKLVPITEATFEDISGLAGGSETIRIYKGPVFRTNGVKTQVLELDTENIAQLHGIYDLPLIGGEKHDVEHRFQYLTGGPPITMHSLDGAFIEAGEGRLCQLQDDYEDNEFADGSREQLRRLNQHIREKKIDSVEAESLRKTHSQKRKKFLEQRKSKPKSESYYPAGGLPKDSVYVVRTNALTEFVKSVNEDSVNAEKSISNREHTTYLNIIAALLELVQTPRVGRDSQDAVITELVNNYGEKPGISKRNLAGKFSDAKKSLQNS